MDLTSVQIKAFRKLWFIYGNDGRKETLFNHKLIQGFVEYREDRREAYREGNENMKIRFKDQKPGFLKARLVTDECFEVCNLVLENKIEEAMKIAKTQA